MGLIALLSDVHANLVALEAVLRDVPREARLWVMGDTVGYGPDPSDVLALLRERGARLVAGNHDLAVAGQIGLREFNGDAMEAAILHRSWLSRPELDFLASLPRTAVEGDFTLVHGSLRDPVWEYVLDDRAAKACLRASGTTHCCNGHTHLPRVWIVGADGRPAPMAHPPRDGEAVRVADGRALVNPGSVGQPRDGDPRSSWALLDTAAGIVTFRRTTYEIEETQRRMRARQLPEFLAERLAFGM